MPSFICTAGTGEQKHFIFHLLPPYNSIMDLFFLKKNIINMRDFDIKMIIEQDVAVHSLKLPETVSLFYLTNKTWA
jgi:hypothetical protein